VRLFLAVTTALSALTVTAVGTPLAVPAGVLLALVLPGCALVLLLGRGTAPRATMICPALTRPLWACGLSLAVCVLGGLLLNLFPAGLTRVTWTVFLSTVTLLVLAASPARPLPVFTVRAITVRQLSYAVATCGVIAGAITLAVISAGWRRGHDFAELWLTPAQHTGQVTLGVRSAYAQAERFRVELRRGPRTVRTWDLTLAAGQSWRQDLTAAGGQPLTATLTGPATLTVSVTP